MTLNVSKELRKAAGLSFSDWCYLAVATKELFIARIRHAAQPVGKILCQLQANEVSPRYKAGGGAASEVDVERLSWAIAAAATLVPWRSDCLLRVMAADRWLRRYGLRPDFFLGVAKDTRDIFQAHAWLRYGEFTVAGGTKKEFITLVAPPME